MPRCRDRRSALRHLRGGTDDGDFVFTPFGHLADGNPYDAYLPPDPGDPGGFMHPGTPGEAP
jgi:hypothetical protein